LKLKIFYLLILSFCAFHDDIQTICIVLKNDIHFCFSYIRTNHEDALSPRGIEQVQADCKWMIENDIVPTVVKYSLAAKAMETANVVASELKVGCLHRPFLPRLQYFNTHLTHLSQHISSQGWQK